MFRCKRTSQSVSRKGFTLIELLVVIAILTLIISILLPSLQQAKELARETVCVSNARNIGVIMQYYAQDNDNRLPIPFDQYCIRNQYYSWPVALGQYITEDPSAIDNAYPMSTSFQPERVVKCFQCPTLLGVHPTTKNSYVMNNYGFSDPDCFYNGLNVEVIDDPYRRIAVGEGAYSYQPGGAQFQETFLRTTNLGFYHNGGEITGTVQEWFGPEYEQTNGRGILLMVDGHALTAIADDISKAYFTTPY